MLNLPVASVSTSAVGLSVTWPLYTCTIASATLVPSGISTYPLMLHSGICTCAYGSPGMVGTLASVVGRILSSGLVRLPRTHEMLVISTHSIARTWSTNRVARPGVSVFVLCRR